MIKTIECAWTGNLTFQANVNDHLINLDADEENGGINKGPRPKALLLAGLAGCTGMDVIAILKKMKVEFEAMNITVDANLTDNHPKIFDTFHITYLFRGEDIPLDKIEKAITLSQDKYCGVSEMFRTFAKLTYEIVIENKV